jgi:hypothetical protein
MGIPTYFWKTYWYTIQYRWESPWYNGCYWKFLLTSKSIMMYMCIDFKSCTIHCCWCCKSLLFQIYFNKSSLESLIIHISFTPILKYIGMEINIFRRMKSGFFAKHSLYRLMYICKGVLNMLYCVLVLTSGILTLTFWVFFFFFRHDRVFSWIHEMPSILRMQNGITHFFSLHVFSNNLWYYLAYLSPKASHCISPVT